jgi:hypothetical protein
MRNSAGEVFLANLANPQHYFALKGFSPQRPQSCRKDRKAKREN